MQQPGHACILNVIQQLTAASGAPLEEQARIQSFCTEEYWSDVPTKHYEFLGKGVFEFSIHESLRQLYGRHCSEDSLEHMRRLLLSQNALADAIAKQYKLYECGAGDAPIGRLVQRLFGVVVQSSLGIFGAVAMVTTTIEQYGSKLLCQMPRPIRVNLGLMPPPKDSERPVPSIDTAAASINSPIPKDQRPIAVPQRRLTNSTTVAVHEAFAQLVRAGEHTTEYTERSLPDNKKEWQCAMMYRLTRRARWFCHTRYASTKKRSRTLVVHDIVQYYERQPEQRSIDAKEVTETTTAAGQGMPLPIDVDEFYHEPSPVCTPPPSMDWYHPVAGNSQLCAIHIPEKRSTDDMDMDEYNQRMMEVLLDGFPRMTVDKQQLQQQQDEQAHHEKRLKSSSSSCAMMATSDSEQHTPPPTPSEFSVPLPALETPNASIDVVRKQLDISRIEKILSDPVQVSNPKSSLLSYVVQLKDVLNYTADVAATGPSHNRMFVVTTTLASGEHRVSGVGQGFRKVDAEQMAILNLLRTLAVTDSLSA